MTLPVPRFPEFSYHCIFRFREARYYGLPTFEFAQALLTIIGRALDDYSMEVAAWSLMGTHLHIIIFDRDQHRRISMVDPFVQFVGGSFAKWLNARWDLGGKVVDPDVDTTVFAITDVESELRSVAYVGLNPVAAGIVEDVALVEATTSIPEFLMEPLAVERPDTWFDKRKWPALNQIRLSVPPLANRAGYSRFTWFLKLRATQEFWRAQIILERRKSGRTSDTLDWAKLQDPYEPRGRLERGTPILFTGDNKVLLAKLFAHVRAFRRSYRRSKTRLASRAGTVFPRGTSRIAWSLGLAVEPGCGPATVRSRSG